MAEAVCSRAQALPSLKDIVQRLTWLVKQAPLDMRLDLLAGRNNVFNICCIQSSKYSYLLVKMLAMRETINSKDDEEFFEYHKAKMHFNS